MATFMDTSSENLHIFLHASQVLHVTCYTFNGARKFGTKAVENIKHTFMPHTLFP
jgi:hypothetical protein